MQYSNLSKVFLKGDFNANAENRKCDTYDLEDLEMMHLISLKNSGTQCSLATKDQTTEDMENLY